MHFDFEGISDDFSVYAHFLTDRVFSLGYVWILVRGLGVHASLRQSRTAKQSVGSLYGWYLDPEPLIVPT